MVTIKNSFARWPVKSKLAHWRYSQNLFGFRCGKPGMNKLKLLLVFVLWLSESHQGSANGPQFMPADTSPIVVGRGSGAIFLVDLNRDGHVDLLTTHLLSRSVSVFSGDGTGRFVRDSTRSLKLPYQPGRVAVADVNNDGLLDLGVASRTEENESVNIFLGGKLGFQSTSTITIGPSAKTYKPHLYFVDLNEDGKLDMVTSSGRRNSIEILLGDGDGKFAPHDTVKLPPARNYYSFNIGDIDGDARTDLVIAVSGTEAGLGPGHVEVRRGNGRGRFEDATAIPAAVLTEPRVAALADIDGDGHLDVVLTHSERNQLSILLNQGDGSLVIGYGSPIDVGLPAYSAAVGDVNGDAKADLVIATVSSESTPFNSKLVVLLGDGGGFRQAPGSPLVAGPGAYNVTLADVNSDGKPDVAASSFGGDAVTLLLGQ
jgi:hypothetical protein